MPTVSRGVYKWLFCRSATLDDFADRLNHFWTFGLFLLFAAIISWRQIYTSPIQCWTPAQFTPEHSSYASNKCWNRPYIQYQKDIDEAWELIEFMDNETSIGYVPPRLDMPYLVENTPSSDPLSELLQTMSTTRTLHQWLPLILCFQALLFKLPNILMYFLHGMSGVSFDKLSGLTAGFERLSLQERSILCRQIGRYIYNWCQQSSNCLPWRQLTFLWLFVKCLYIINCVVQLSLLDGILAPENATSFGDVIAVNLFDNNASLWREAPIFPKQVLCDFRIIQLANIHRYTMQCDLTANYFNEFTYMFIWVWLLFVTMTTCVSLFVWILKTLVPICRQRYVKKSLSLNEGINMSTMSSYDVDKLCDVTGEDGVMVLKLIGDNSSDLIVSEVLMNMWKLKSSENVSPSGGQIIAAPSIQVQPTEPSVMYPSLETGDIKQGEKKMD
ncbi:hypothetical protein ACF0H5_022098 [Mactra antiquata]